LEHAKIFAHIGAHTEHEIHGTDHGHSVSKKMALRHMVETSEMGEARSTDVHTIRALGAVADDIDTHLALGSLDGRVRIARGNSVTLGVQKEVVDKGFHVFLHGSTGRRGDLVVLDADRAGRHLVEALVDDAQRLTELLHAAQVTVVAVAIDTNRDIELDLAVSVIGGALANIPRNAGTTEHHTGKGQVEGVSGRDHADSLETVDPDTVVRQHLLSLVDTVTELGGPLVDIIEEADGDILMNTTGTDIGSVETGT
jgi:hypothetical protein